MYANNWKKFVQYFEEKTSKPYGHVTIDLFPNTPDSERIVRDDDSCVEIVKKNSPMLDAQKMVWQVQHPNADELTKSALKMTQALNQPNVSDDIKSKEHVEALNMFMKN